MPAHFLRERPGLCPLLVGPVMIMDEGLISLADVQRLIPHSRTWFFRRERAGRFPKRLSKRSKGEAVLYVRAEILAYIAAAAATRHEPNAWKTQT